jgi:hypothetical protein
MGAARRSCQHASVRALGYRYQKFISDIAGQDIYSHGLELTRAIAITRDWLRNCAGRPLPGGTEIHRQYRRFIAQLPAICKVLRLKPSEMTYNDFTNIVSEWLKISLMAVRP